MIKTTYIMSMIVAALLLIVSVFLIIISFVVLKYTIGFTLSEEFREIGVMKAIGMKNSNIRVLYLTKYFFIAIAGALVGFILSIPFSEFMLGSVSESIYISSENSVFIALLCSVAVIGIILFFCWTSTKKIKKFSPIDAVRNGQTGERFRKKSLMHLNKSKLKTSAFLATNDMVSAPKQYSIITIVFSILLMLIMILANTANTLNSDKLLFLLGCTKSDAYVTLVDATMKATGVDTDSQQSLQNTIEQIKKDLNKNNMPGKVHVEGNLTLNLVTKEVTKDNRMLEMTTKEFELLKMLLENKGQTMTKNRLFNSIWGIDSESELQTLTVHIKWLREKIENDPKNPVHIITVWGKGYRWEDAHEKL